MPRSPTTIVKVGPQGRIVIPAALRKAVGIEVGDSLTARFENGGIVLERPETIVARLRERFRAVPSTVSLAEELIQERRDEARQSA